MFSHSQFDVTRQYLNAMHLSAIVTCVMTSNSLLHIFWCWLFVDYLDLEVTGVGIATMTSYTLNFFAITILCMFLKNLNNTFFFFTRESF